LTALFFGQVDEQRVDLTAVELDRLDIEGGIVAGENNQEISRGGTHGCEKVVSCQ
jgi:hypothetical protein